MRPGVYPIRVLPHRVGNLYAHIGMDVGVCRFQRNRHGDGIGFRMFRAVVIGPGAGAFLIAHEAVHEVSNANGTGVFLAEIQRIENGLDSLGVKAAAVFRHGVYPGDLAVDGCEAVLHIRNVLPVCFRNGTRNRAAVVAEVEHRRIVIRSARHKTEHDDHQDNERREDGGDNPANRFSQLVVC
ncbi:hypothetical protein SDC9_67105 [bioreactor metagenome]|uniref:Uncharacterized protein n=1 Tax=bioreactor metagenome TaxID=1076179 RepID=A0A644XX54_9ZZZZ